MRARVWTQQQHWDPAPDDRWAEHSRRRCCGGQCCPGARMHLAAGPAAGGPDQGGTAAGDAAPGKHGRRESCTGKAVRSCGRHSRRSRESLPGNGVAIGPARTAARRDIQPGPTQTTSTELSRVQRSTDQRSPSNAAQIQRSPIQRSPIQRSPIQRSPIQPSTIQPSDPTQHRSSQRALSNCRASTVRITSNQPVARSCLPFGHPQAFPRQRTRHTPCRRAA